MVWTIGEILLELLCVSIMVGSFIFGMNNLNASTELTRKNMYASDYQNEYATFSVYEGSDIAYTEVLNCVYTYSDSDFPVYITPLSNASADPESGYEVKYTKVTSTYKEISDYLRNRSLTYRGEILRLQGGSIYGIRFIY